LDLEMGNRTPDTLISAMADSEGLIVVSKDSDFVVSLLLKGTPRRLLQISTGNIPNSELRNLLRRNLQAIESAFEIASHVEINRTSLIIHS
jgi:predicted nuclease of predicted toxin-antitoxin system